MNKQKPQQSHIQITVRFVEKQNVKKALFDARKILRSLNHLTHDDRLIRRINARVPESSVDLLAITAVMLPWQLASTGQR